MAQTPEVKIKNRVKDKIEEIVDWLWEELKLPTEKGAERTVTTPDIEGGRR